MTPVRRFKVGDMLAQRGFAGAPFALAHLEDWNDPVLSGVIRPPLGPSQKGGDLSDAVEQIVGQNFIFH